MYDPTHLQQGAQNLLLNCAELKAGERLLLVQEDPELGWYDTAAPQAIADAALMLGALVTSYPIHHISNETDQALETLRAEHDVTVFFARAGDQNRFAELRTGQRSVMCYARNAAMLASAYGCTHHHAMLSLKNAINRCIFNARQLEIRCPLGTHYVGELPGNQSWEADDVSVLRFPMGVHAPVSANFGHGKIALPNYLTTTGTHAYQPDHAKLEGTVFAHIDGLQIREFTGAPQDVKKVHDHYNHVSGMFDIDAGIVHSWHAGIHGGNPCSAFDHEHPDRWANTAFTHPKVLHFHTCGDYAPGEICWNVQDADVMLDGVLLWQGGRLCLENFSPLIEAVKQWPELKIINERNI